MKVELTAEVQARAVAHRVVDVPDNTTPEDLQQLAEAFYRTVDEEDFDITEVEFDRHGDDVQHRVISPDKAQYYHARWRAVRLPTPKQTESGHTVEWEFEEYCDTQNVSQVTPPTKPSDEGKKE